MKIGVVMPVYFGDYPNSASNKEDKFKRAVISFLQQDYEDKFLIIVADGEEAGKKADLLLAESIEIFSEDINMLCSLLKKTEIEILPKQQLFSGVLRNSGIDYCKFEKCDIICYLDADDVFLPNHLSGIVDSFKKNPSCDWMYFTDNAKVSEKEGDIRGREPKIMPGYIGTSQIAHKASIESKWTDGYYHDFHFVNSMRRYKVAHGGRNGYLVCHIPGIIDL